MRTRMAGAGCAVALAAGGMALAPTVASASWLEPQLLSEGGADANNPHVAMDDDGDALAVWNRVDGAFNRIEARPRTASGVWGPVSPPLSNGGQHATDPRVALDADGDALIVWLRSDGTAVRVQARTRSKAGVLGPIQTLSGAGEDANEPQVAMDDDGDAVVAWYRSDGSTNRAQARTRSAAGTWTRVFNLSPSGTNAFSPRVAIDDAGDAIVAWYRDDGDDSRVQIRTHPAAGPWSGLTNISPAGLQADDPDVDTDQDGDTLIAWQQQDASGLQRIEARHRTAAGVLGPQQPLSSTTGSDVDVAMSPGGQATLVWRRASGGNGHIESRTRAVNGAWTDTRVLSDTPGDATEPRTAAGSAPGGGTAVAAWGRLDADGDRRIESRPWVQSAWRPFTTLSRDDADAAVQQVAMERSGGEAIAVWRISDGGFFRIEGTSGP